MYRSKSNSRRDIAEQLLSWIKTTTPPPLIKSIKKIIERRKMILTHRYTFLDYYIYSHFKESLCVKYYGGPPRRLPIFQLVLRKQFDKLKKELIHCLNTIAFVYR